MAEAARTFMYLYVIGPVLSLAALTLLMHRVGYSRVLVFAPVLTVAALMTGLEAINVFGLGYPLLAWGFVPLFTAASTLVIPATLIALAVSKRVGGVHA